MSTSSPEKPLIFILDNDETIAEVLPIDLKDAGADSLAFTLGSDARREFLRLYTKPGYKSPIFLVDIAISPAETGWDFVDFIRRYDKTCLIFMFTGALPVKVIDKYLLSKHQANGFIRKPKDGLEILAEIRRYQTKGTAEIANGQAGRWMFTDQQMGMFALQMIILVLVVWFVADMHGTMNSIRDDVSLLKGQAIATDKAVSRIQGKNDAKLEGQWADQVAK